MKQAKYLLFIIYAILLLYIVFFARRRGDLIWNDAVVNLIPVINTIQSFQNIEKSGIENVLSNLFGNIIIFTPIPFFAVTIFNIHSSKNIILLGGVISVLIELTQYALHVGVPDIDDVLLNLIGVLLGLYIHRILITAFR